MSSRACRLRVLGRLRISVGATRLRCSANFSRSFSKVEPDLRSATSLPSVEAWTQAEIVGEWHYDSGMSYFVEPDAHGHLHFNEWDRPLVCTRAKSKKFLLNRGIHHHGSLAPDEDGWFSGQLLNQDGSHIGDLRMKYDQPQGVMITQCRPPLSDWGNVTRARRDKELATTGSFTQYAVLGTLLFAGAMLLQELNWRNSLRALFAVAGMESYSDELEQMVKDVWAAKPKEPSAAESELDWLDFTHDMGGYKDRISREQPFKVRGNRSGAVHGRSDGHQADGNGGTPAARLSSAEQQDLQEFLEVLQESLKGDDLPVAVRKCGASDEKHQVWQEPNLRQAWSIGDEQGASFGEGEDLAENLWPLLARLSSKDRDALLSKMADLQRQVQAGDVNSRKKLEELCRHLGLERPGGLDGESGHLNPQDLAAAMAAAQKRMACLEARSVLQAADGGSTQWSNLSVQSTALQQLLKGCEESSWRLSQGLLQVADGDATANALLSALGNEPSTTAHLSAALQRLATLDDQLQQQRAALGARGRRRNGGLEDEVLSQFLQEKSDALSVLKDTAKDLLDENSRSQVYDAWQSQLTSALEHVVATGITGAEEDGSPSQRIPGSPSSPTAAMEEARQRLAALEAARAARHRRPRFKAGSTFAEHDPSWWQKLPTEESLGDNRQGLQERLRRHHEMLQQWRLEVGEQAEQDLPMLAAELAMHERLLSNMLENGGLQELIEADEELEDLLRACRDGAQILSLEILEASTSDPTTAALLALRSATSADGLGETRSETLDAALSRLAAWAEGLEEQREAMRCGAPLDGALLATLAAERADLLKWMEDQGNSGCDGLQQLRALLAERSSELEMMAGTQRSAVSAAEAGGAAAEDLSEQGERDPDGTKKKTFGDDDLLSELEEANRRLARFDAELEKQRKGLQRRRRKKGQEAFVDPEVLASLVQERAALVDWAEDRLQKSEDPSLVAFRQQCRDAARRLEQLVMEDLQGAERFAAGSVDPTALLAEARRRLLMLEEEGNQRLRRRQRVLPGAEEAIGEDPEDPFGTKKTRFDDHDWQSNLEEARRRLRRFEEQLEEQRSGLRRRRKNGEDASLPEEVLASLVSERAELVEWAEDQLKTSGGAPSLVAFREQCRDAARRLEQLVVEDLDGAGSKAAVDPSALLAEARRRLILMEEEAAKQRLKRRQRGEHAAATPGRGTASSRPKVVRDEDPEVLMADAARRLARLEEELESQRQGLCRRRLQPKTEAPEVQAAHALMHESAIEELKDQRDGCRAECDRLLRAAMANDTMWSPEQRATCNELQEKCLELEEAWNSCADTAEQLKEEVAEAAMPSRLTALLRSKDSHQAEASEALLEAMRRVASFDHELEQQRNLMKRPSSVQIPPVMGIMDSKTLEMKLLDFLRQTDEEWTETLKLAKAVGKTTKGDVNPTLYTLEKQGQAGVLKDPKSTKPRWQICRKLPASPASPSSPASPPAAPPEEATDMTQPPPVTDVTTDLTVPPVPLSAGYWNPKGTLQEKFGEHAVEWKQAPGTSGTSFQYEVYVASMKFVGLVQSTKAAAQQSAAEQAMATLVERPELLPQDGEKCDAGGFESTVSATGTAAASSSATWATAMGRGRRKIDAEHFAARALLEKLREVMPPASAVSVKDDFVLQDAGSEARSGASASEANWAARRELRELGKLGTKEYVKKGLNMAPCISEAFRLKLIDDTEKKRLQEINGRGNCAKHTPERLEKAGRRKAAVDTSAEDAILTALLEEKRQAMAECEEMAPKDEAWEDLHLLWQGPLTTSLVELAADTPAKGAKVQRGSVNAAEKNQALAEAQRRLEMLDEESQRQRLGLQRRRKVAEQAGRQELEKLVEGGTEFEHLAAEHREGLNHQQNNIKEVMASDLEPLEEIESWRQMVGLEELQAAAGKMSEQLATIEEAEGEEMAVESPEKRQKRRLDGPVGVSVEDRSAAKHQCEEMQVRLQEMRQDEEERQRLLMQRRQRKVKEPPEHAEKAAQMTEENSRDLLLKAHATRPYTAQLFRSEFAAFLFRAMALLPWLLCISWTVPSRGTGSCKEIGCGGHDETCWCVASCWSFNDCCHDYAAVCPEKPPSVQLSEVNFLVTTDLHSWIEGRRHQPHLDASLAHVASVLEHLRQSARSAQRDVFFFDNGDINDGTGLSASAEDHVEYLVPVLRSAKYDALNVGNHELYQRNGYGMLPGAACPIVGLKESGYIDSWKGRYLTSNVVWAKSQQPIGERYAVIEGEFGTKLLVFGFLYNMRDHCDAVQVLKVEDVVNSTWFQDAVDGHAAQVDAVVVLAHMDYRDGLVDLLWRSLRSRVGETKPIQVFAGHSHIRGYRQLDNFSSVYEAGCKLDTVGFLSFQHRADGSGLDFDHANITGNVHDMAGAATGVFSGMKDH
eukprot:s784_g13.t2